MTDYTWLGALSTSANTAGNWAPAVVPAAGDRVLFTAGAARECVWDIPLPVSPTLTVDEVIIESDFNEHLQINTKLRTKALYVAGEIRSGGTSDEIEFFHGASPNFFGSYKSFNERFVMIHDDATMTGITLTMNGAASPITKFDDGQYPTVTLAAGTFAPDYKTPTGTSGKASFTSLTIDSGVTFEPDGDLVDDDRLKVFSFTAITISSSEINFGLSTAEFTATGGGFYIPTYGATGYVSDFQAYYRKIVLKANTAGHKVLMDDNTFVSVEEFEIDDGVVLKGPVADDAQGAEIRSTTPPKIRGTWSFSQVSQGLYRSPRQAPGVMAKVNGDFHITGKLDVDGLIDPTGLELNPQSSNPGGVAANTIWINSGDSNKLYFGSSEVGGGGGGGGTVDVVSNVATNTILGRNDSGSGDSEELTPAEVRTMLNVEDGADVTDATNVQAAGALMDSEVTNLADVKAFDPAAYATAAQGTTADGALPKAGGTMTGEIEATTLTLNAAPADPGTDDKVRLGESGDGSNMLQIQSNDGYIRIGANNGSYGHVYTDRAQFYYSKPILIDGGGQLFAYNDGLKLGTGTTASAGTVAITIADGSADITVAGQTTSTAFVKTGGLSSQFLKADGSIDPTAYAPATPETCMVRLTTGVANFTPTGAYTLLQKTSNWDASPANSNFDDTTGLYTVPSDGVYRISWGVSFRFTGSGQTQASRIYVNGTAAAQGQANTTGNWPVPGGSILLSLSANDTVGLYVYISNTGKTLVGDDLSAAATQMSINKVSD